MQASLSMLGSSLACPQAGARSSFSISILFAASPNPSPCLQFLPSTKSFQEVQSQLNRAAVGLNQSANELVQVSRGTPQDLAMSSSKFGQDFNEFLQAGVEMASQSLVRANTRWGILSMVRGLGCLGRQLTAGRVARQQWLGWLWPTQLMRWGSGAVQNCSSRGKVAWVGSASVAAISLLLVDELDEGLSLETTREDPGLVWSLETCCR